MRTRLITLFSFLLISSFFVSAQKDVTTFLGIPVDGYKSEMKKKLISKGYTPKTSGSNDFLEGEFNGSKVYIYIGTNNNKVFRLMVSDAITMDEANIKNRFNKLVGQFERNKRYASFIEDQTIPESENISYEMTVHNKIYEAVFYQKPDFNKVDTLAIQNKVKQKLLEKYSESQLNNPTEEIQNEIVEASLAVGADLLLKKPVWFRIEELYGKYYISIFYDNEYNHADGEDL